MPLSVVVPLAVAAIVVIVVVAMRLSARKRPTAMFEGRAEVALVLSEYLKAQGEEHPDISWCGVSEDGFCAIAEIRDGRVAFLKMTGSRPTVRLLDPDEIKALEISRDGFSLSFRLTNRAWPKTTVVFDDVGTAGYARSLLKRFENDPA